MHASRRPNTGHPKDVPVAPPQRVPSRHPRGPTEAPPQRVPSRHPRGPTEAPPKTKPDPRSARNAEPDPRSARRPEPDPRSARRAEPDPRSARKAEPDPRSARRAEPDPRSARRAEPDPRSARKAEPDPRSARNAEPDPRSARRPEPEPVPERMPERRPQPVPELESERKLERKTEPIAEPEPEPQHTAASLLSSGPPPAPLSVSEAALAAERAVYERRLRDFFARHRLQRSDAEIAAAVSKAQRQPAGLRSLWRSLVERHGEAPARFALGTLEELMYPASAEVREIASGLVVRPALYNELCKFFADDDGGNFGDGRVLALQFTGMNTALYDAAPPDARAAFRRAIEVQLSVLADCSPSRFNVTWDCTGVAVVRILTESDNNQVDSHDFTYRNHYPNYNDDDRSCEAIKAALVKAVRCGGGMLHIVRDSYRRDLSGGGGAMSIALAQVPSTATIIQSVPPAPRPSEPNGHTLYDGGRQRFAYNGASPASLLSSSSRQQATVRMPSESVASIMASVHDAPLPLETQFVAPVCGVRKPSRPLVLPTESPSRSDWAATEWIERSYRGGF